MENKDKDIEMEKLTKILSIIQNLYYKKKEYIEELELEVSELKNVLNYLNSLVSNRSFHSADEIYNRNKKKEQTEEYFNEEITNEKVKGTNIKRKIFTKDEKELLCVLNFEDLNQVNIKFINPEIRAIKETSDDFITLFLKGALIKIKENNPAMNLKYKYFKDSDIIEKIEIVNLKLVKDYDLITSKIRQLLAKD